MQGDGAGRKTTTVRRKRRGIGGIGLTQQTRYIGTNNTLQGRELHERLPRLGDENAARSRSLEPPKGKHQVERSFGTSDI